MPPPPHTKPENVLKRAQELVGVNQNQAALALLHEHATSKRTRNHPIASIEPVMLLFVELCVDLRKGKAAKDGLYSYKNTAQNTNVGTIELVLGKFIELAEAKVTDAQTKAEAVQSSLDSTTTVTANVDDLENSETPESILLSTVSGEQSKDRTDRAIVTPWLKFLWETYRTVLDILKNNARLELMYQSTAHRAFQFCLKYQRKTEFRRLCELLRTHLQNATKYQSQVHAINLTDPDTLQRHLDTRFQQLQVAVDLELWQEAFRSIEDIHYLLNTTKRPARNVMMATYFEKLATIFLVSENYLFHAAAYSRYFNLLRTSAHVVATGQSPKKDNPSVTEADLTNCASFVILSALSIPVISTQRSRGALVDVDEARKSKNARLTSLTGMNTPPSRALLLKEALSKGLLRRARPEIRDLYNILEVDFHPLSICKKISPILSQIGADPDLGKYVHPLQQVILTRLFQQLSQVYESVELKYVLGLAQFPEPFNVNTDTVEKFIMNGCKKGDLAIRIDHASGVITFDQDVFTSGKALHPGSTAGSAESEVGTVQRLQSTPAEIVRSQLIRLAKSLHTTCLYVDPTFSEDRRRARAAALQRAEAGANKEHLETLERRVAIQKKKEAASSALAQKQKEEDTRKRLRAQEQQQAEIQRLEQEQRERDQKRARELQARVQREEAEKQLKELKSGIKLDMKDINIDELDTGRIRALKIQQLEREKNELGERLRVTGKRIDHLERAFRREEQKHLPADFEAQRKADEEEYEKIKEQTLIDAEEKHKSDVELKRRFARLLPSYEQFRDRKRNERRVEFERRRKVAEKELETKKLARIRDFRQQKVKERQDREEQERKEREEEERKEREAEEEAARQEERRRKAEETRKKQEEERKRLDDIAARQRQRELEAEERRKERAAAPPQRNVERPAAAGSNNEAAAGTSEPPRFVGSRGAGGGGGGGGGWREREAAKKAAEASGATAAAASPDAGVGPTASATAQAQLRDTGEPPRRAGGGYVPPALRGNAGASGSGMGERTYSRGRDDKLAPPTRTNGASGNSPSPNRPDRTESPAAPSAAASAGGAGGRYVPGAFSKRRAGGS